MSSQRKSNMIARETVKEKRKVLFKQKRANHSEMTKKKKKVYAQNLPFQETLTTCFAIEELKCYNILVTNQQSCGPQSRKPFKI